MLPLEPARRSLARSRRVEPLALAVALELARRLQPLEATAGAGGSGPGGGSRPGGGPWSLPEPWPSSSRRVGAPGVGALAGGRAAVAL